MKRPSVLALLFILSMICVCLFLGPKDLASALNPQADLGAKWAQWTELDKAVRQRVTEFKGEVGLVIKDLGTGWTIQVNPDKLFPAASMVKIPIMTACLKAAQEGRFSLQDHVKLLKSDKVRGSGVLWTNRSGSIHTIDQLMELMITQSDNTAANILIDLLGFDYLSNCFRQIGLEKTTLSRKMMDFSARARGRENYTTAREMADILEKIYRKACFCSKISEKCLELLKSQKVNDRIPRLLPKDIVVAHKTGLERQVCHDAGIIFTPRGDFLISAFTRTTRGSRVAKSFIAKASSIAYKIYTEPNPMAAAYSGGARAGR